MVSRMVVAQRPRKSFRAKLQEAAGLPRVVPIPAKLRASWGAGTLVIAAPIEVDALMRKVRKGRLTTLGDLRRALAARHGATTACPLTTAIFAGIAAHAAAEDESDGRQRITPWWRTLKPGGELNPKYPGGLVAQRARLVAEGHRIEVRGKRWFVRDHERRLVRWGP